jgi:hypothetical protein
MAFWSKPNIDRLIKNKDYQGLERALDCPDYYTIKSAIIGLISLNQPIIDIDKVLYLITDPDPEIRKIAFKYLPLGQFGLFANVAAIHDTVNSIRFDALEILNTYHMPRALPVIKRSARYDPDSTIREKAKHNFEDFVSDHPEEIGEQYSVIDKCDYGWLSNFSLMEDLFYLVEKNFMNNPIFVFYKNNSNVEGFDKAVYDSPSLKTCRSCFENALAIFPQNEKKSVTQLLYANNLAVEGMNALSSPSGAGQMREAFSAFHTIHICTTILIAKMTKM